MSDGRAISAPLTWSRRLVAAAAAERADYSISPSVTVVEWPSVDEHIALWSMLRVPEEVVLAAPAAGKLGWPPESWADGDELLRADRCYTMTRG